MKRLLITTSLFLAIFVAFAQQASPWHTADKPINFYITSDNGRNGYYDQKTIAERMGAMADDVDPECIFAIGDVHHMTGVQSTADPLWISNFENIYSHPDLLTEWHPMLGNHEYRGNTQAVLDYTQVSRRWTMPARYYTKVFTHHGTSIRFVLIDTTPLIDKYRHESDTYPDAQAQSRDQQLQWIDSVLTVAKEQWVVVMGHHPIYASTSKDLSERTDLQQRLDPILRRHKVDFYIGGHVHNFQHIRPAGSTIDYMVNSSASQSRKVTPMEGTVFCSGETGFSVLSADTKHLQLFMVNKEGRVVHTVQRTR